MRRDLLLRQARHPLPRLPGLPGARIRRSGLVTMRVHTANPEYLAVEVLTGDRLNELYSDGFDDVDLALVIEDGGNCEAWVMPGPSDGWVGLALSILRAVPLTPAQRAAVGKALLPVAPPKYAAPDEGEEL